MVEYADKQVWYKAIQMGLMVTKAGAPFKAGWVEMNVPKIENGEQTVFDNWKTAYNQAKAAMTGTPAAQPAQAQTTQPTESEKLPEPQNGERSQLFIIGRELDFSQWPELIKATIMVCTKEEPRARWFSAVHSCPSDCVDAEGESLKATNKAIMLGYKVHGTNLESHYRRAIGEEKNKPASDGKKTQIVMMLEKKINQNAQHCTEKEATLIASNWRRDEISRLFPGKSSLTDLTFGQAEKLIASINEFSNRNIRNEIIAHQNDAKNASGPTVEPSKSSNEAIDSIDDDEIPF